MKRSTRSFLVVIIILLSLAAVSCAKQQDSQPKQTNESANVNVKNNGSAVKSSKPGDFFPSASGLSWEYQGEGNEYATFTRKVVFTDGDLAQIREDNGGTVSASVYQITPEAVTRKFFLGEAYDETNYLKNEPNQNLIIIESPLEVGTKWNDPNGTKEIVDIKASVDTPVGNFTDCLKIKIPNQGSIVYEYYKEGIGLVKREFISDGNKITSSLKKYGLEK